MGSRLETARMKQIGTWGSTQATSLLSEFRSFALKGNVVDLAVGVIIGAAFAKIVDSLVKNILMPVISLVFPSDTTYLGWKFTVDGKDIPYGLFLGDILNFVIVASALFFFVVKFLGWLARTRRVEAAAPPPAAPVATREEVLLGEIRDLLKSGRT